LSEMNQAMALVLGPSSFLPGPSSGACLVNSRHPFSLAVLRPGRHVRTAVAEVVWLVPSATSWADGLGGKEPTASASLLWQPGTKDKWQATGPASEIGGKRARLPTRGFVGTLPPKEPKKRQASPLASPGPMF
jgi:hypothetical protein